MGYLDDVAVEEHCARINWFRTVVLGFFDAGVLRGAAELDIARKNSSIRCEVAVTVEAAWQDQGVATNLLRRMLVIARNRWAQAVQIYCSSDNLRIQRIAKKFGARFRSRSGESEAEIHILGPSYWSLSEEWIDDALGWTSTWFDRTSPRSPSVVSDLGPDLSPDFEVSLELD
jgi:RimJ/RimL family protein N-acetyltransferase